MSEQAGIEWPGPAPCPNRRRRRAAVVAVASGAPCAATTSTEAATSARRSAREDAACMVAGGDVEGRRRQGGEGERVGVGEVIFRQRDRPPPLLSPYHQADVVPSRCRRVAQHTWSRRVASVLPSPPYLSHVDLSVTRHHSFPTQENEFPKRKVASRTRERTRGNVKINAG